MLANSRVISVFVSCAVMTSIVAFSSGCATGTTRLKISHAPLESIQQRQQGNVVVHPFVDKRARTEYIGNKRNGFGMVLGHVGLHPGVKLDELLTQYFAEALKEAGYNAVIEAALPGNAMPKTKCDVVIDGDIVEFWMDLYMMVWHRVGVDIRATQPGTDKVLWQKRIEGAEKRTLWLGVTAEFERVVREAMTKALNRASQEFASRDFYEKAVSPSGVVGAPISVNNQNSSDISDRLKKLQELKESGTITEEEFQTQRKVLVEKL